MNTRAFSDGRFVERVGLVFVHLFFLLTVLINLTPFLDSQNALMDFGSFYASGLKLQNGENPYDPNSEYIFEIDFSRVGAGGKMVNLNPPISVMLFEVLSRFDPYRSLVIWQIASALIYIGSIFLLVSTYKQNISATKFIWAFTLAGFWHTIVLGQVYAVLLLFCVLGWVSLRRGQYILAGIAIGLLIAIKPNFIIWPVFLLISGYSLTFAISLLSGLIVSLIPLAFYGTKIYTQWLEASSLRLETLTMPGNNSLLGLSARFHSISLGIVISVILVIGLFVLSRLKSARDMERSEYLSALGIIASLLASPISWTGYTILLLPIYFNLKKWTVPTIASAAILSIPFAIVLQLFQNSFSNFVIFGWLYGWGILLLLAVVVRNTMMTKSIQTN
jgi:Glycosyltransferase family 87